MTTVGPNRNVVNAIFIRDVDGKLIVRRAVPPPLLGNGSVVPKPFLNVGRCRRVRHGWRVRKIPKESRLVTLRAQQAIEPQMLSTDFGP